MQEGTYLRTTAHQYCLAQGSTLDLSEALSLRDLKKHSPLTLPQLNIPHSVPNNSPSTQGDAAWQHFIFYPDSFNNMIFLSCPRVSNVFI